MATWPLGDSGVDITIPLLNDDKTAFVWPVGYQSITAYLTRVSDRATISVGVVAGSAVVSGVTTGAAILVGPALTTLPGDGRYAVEIVLVDAAGLRVILPTAGGLELLVRAADTVRPS